MKKFRIIEKCGEFRVQYKFLWFWLTVHMPWGPYDFGTKENAEKWIKESLDWQTTDWKEV